MILYGQPKRFILSLLEGYFHSIKSEGHFLAAIIVRLVGDYGYNYFKPS